MDMTTSFTLSEKDGGTSMAWEADVKIAGPVGAMGQRVLQPIVNQQVSLVLTALEQRVGEVGGSGSGADGIDPASPEATEAYEAQADAPSHPTTES
jgi:hypothetical protein